MKDFGEADIILGVEIRKTKHGFSLCQSHYIEKLFKRFDSFDDSPVITFCDASMSNLNKNKGDIVS